MKRLKLETTKRKCINRLRREAEHLVDDFTYYYEEKIKTNPLLDGCYIFEIDNENDFEYFCLFTKKPKFGDRFAVTNHFDLVPITTKQVLRLIPDEVKDSRDAIKATVYGILAEECKRLGVVEG